MCVCRTYHSQENDFQGSCLAQKRDVLAFHRLHQRRFLKKLMALLVLQQLTVPAAACNLRHPPVKVNGLKGARPSSRKTYVVLVQMNRPSRRRFQIRFDGVVFLYDDGLCSSFRFSRVISCPTKCVYRSSSGGQQRHRRHR